MSKLWQCFCCCDSESIKTKAKKKKKLNKTSTQSLITLDLKEYEIPKHYPSVEACLSEHGLVLMDQIGSGGFGTVYQILDKSDGSLKACKILNTGEYYRDDKKYENLMLELNVLNRVKDNENVIKVFAHFILLDKRTGEENCYIVMELANGGTILTQMTTFDTDGQKLQKRLPEKRAKNYFIQITKGLEYMHMLGIAHLDLKLDNTLVVITPDGNHCIKLTDFGLSRIRFNKKTNTVKSVRSIAGSIPYMSPQLFKLFIYNRFGHKVGKLRTVQPFQADCWALGTCLFIMISANFPFGYPRDSPDTPLEVYIEMYENMKSYKYSISENSKHSYSSHCFDIVNQLLHPKASLRLTTNLALKHPWVLRDN